MTTKVYCSTYLISVCLESLAPQTSTRTSESCNNLSAHVSKMVHVVHEIQKFFCLLVSLRLSLPYLPPSLASLTSLTSLPPSFHYSLPPSLPPSPSTPLSRSPPSFPYPLFPSLPSHPAISKVSLCPHSPGSRVCDA